MPASSTIRKDRLIIGLDFGTTYTGVAFCYSNTPEEIEVIKTWPGGNLINSEKVPTELSYEQGFIWGFQIKPGQRRIQCIKLLLDRNQDIPAFAFRDDAIRRLQDSGRKVVDAVSDYLTEVYKHTMATLTQRFSESFVKNTKIQFVVTVPAVWSDAAKHATLAAAAKAGMGDNLKIISEPEAAACYTLKAIQPNHLNLGNNMVVCDAGGGTVDLITYRIAKLSPLELEEASVGTGGLCGAAFLNFRFEEHVRNLLGKENFTKMVERKPKTWQTALKYFEEYVKRNCSADGDEEFNVPFPGLDDNQEAGVDSGFMVMTSQQVRDIFDPIVKDVIQLIQGQVAAVRGAGGMVSAILLVGGFGQSMYLFERVKEYFRDGSPPPYTESSSSVSSRFRSLTVRNPPTRGHAQAITVMQPPNAWTAVVRGAVLRGLEGTIVTERRSRYHYGIAYNATFDSAIHPLSSRYWSKYNDKYRARDAMQWYVKRNEKVYETRAIKFSFCRHWDGHNFPNVKELRLTLRSSDEATAPVMYDSAGMLTVCKLTANIGDVPRRCWEKLTTSQGEPYWELDYDIEMRIDSARLEFALMIDDVEYGSVNASFED